MWVSLGYFLCKLFFFLYELALKPNQRPLRPWLSPGSPASADAGWDWGLFDSPPKSLQSHVWLPRNEEKQVTAQEPPSLLLGTACDQGNLGLNLHLHPGGDDSLCDPHPIQLGCLRSSQEHPKALLLLLGHPRPLCFPQDTSDAAFEFLLKGQQMRFTKSLRFLALQPSPEIAIKFPPNPAKKRDQQNLHVHLIPPALITSLPWSGATAGVLQPPRP